MDIKSLRYFLAASETENLSRAAERLNVVQSALSHRIKALEVELGTNLFERHGRNIRLSFIGSIFREEAKQILRDVELAKHRVSRAIDGEVGSLRIGFQTVACRNRVVPAALLAFRERCPLVDVTLTSSSGDSLLQSIRNNDLDGAFLYLPAPINDLSRISLASIDWVLALPRKHKLAKHDSLKLKQLREEQFIWLQPQTTPTWHVRLLELCRKGGLEPKIAQEASDEVLILTLVAAGMGVAFALENTQGYWPDHMVVFKTLSDFSMPLSLCFVWNPDNQMPSLKQLISISKDTERRLKSKAAQ